MPTTTTISFLNLSNFNELLMIGFSNGEIRVTTMANPRAYMTIKQHDMHTGSISSIRLNFDERFLISCATDGLIFVHTIDKFMIQQEAKFNPIADIEGIDYMPEDQVKKLTEDKTKQF